MQPDYTISTDQAPTGPDETAVVKLIGELIGAGLVNADVSDDGKLDLELTSAGVKTAQQMAMHKDGHALVLLGALFGPEIGPN